MSAYQVFLLIGLVQGVLLSIGLFFRNWRKKNQNCFFVALVLGVSLALLLKLLYSEAVYIQYPRLWFWADLIAYLVGPLWYFTLRKSTSRQFQLSWQEWAWLSPVAYHVGSMIFYGLMSKEAFLSHTRQSSFTWEFYGFALTVILVNTVYLLKSRRLLQRVDRKSFPQVLIKGQSILLVVLVVWLVAFLAGVILNQNSLGMKAYNMAFASLAILSFTISLMVIVRPNAFYFLTQTFDQSESIAIKALAREILQFLEEEDRLDPGFNLSQLSEKVGVNSSLTSKAINKGLQTSFTDLINEHRINHFLRLVHSGSYANYTYWAIAQEVGFGNKVSFYNAFKKFKGTTPKNYLSSR